MKSDGEIDSYIRNTLHTSNALVGTCRMGSPTDKHAVVDSNLKVRLSTLRVRGGNPSRRKAAGFVTGGGPC